MGVIERVCLWQYCQLVHLVTWEGYDEIRSRAVVFVCVCARARECVRACVRACVRVREE